MKMVGQLFEEADANKDGVLDLEEWLVFRKKFNDFQTKKMGGTSILTRAEDTIGYRGLNMFTPDCEGISQMDLMHGFKTMKMIAMANKFDSEWRIWYFPGFGRPEPLRQLLTHAGCSWEDKAVPFPEWGQYKSTVPGGSLP